MTDPVEYNQPSGFRPGRTISPGTARQLGTLGLFVPAPGQRRTLNVGRTSLEVKSAEGGLLWIGFRELTGGTLSAADLAPLAARFGEWAVDGIPASADPHATSPEWTRLSAFVELLFAAGVTVFLIGTALPDFSADSPFSLLLRVESDEQLAAEHTSGS
jgi:hypothetical protein